jgi:SPP1 gp7 family putative phage head morphogenesis protein
MPQDIYQISDAFRAALLSRERAAASQLVRAYGLSWQRIQIQLARLTRQIEQARARGEDVNQFWLLRQERYFALQGQVLAELRRFIDFAEPAIVAEQKAAVEAAQQQAVTLMSKATGEARVEGSFNKLSPGAVERMVGFAGDGSPLRALLNKLGADAAMRVSDALTEAVALGYNPKKTATQIREALGGNLARALTVARTETIRSYREASRETYLANSDVCEAWQWVAALGPRSCMVCWAMHGTIHPLTEPLASHPACRCVSIPIVDLNAPSRVKPGAEEFARLSEAEQRQILGPGKFAAYSAGKLPLENLVGFRRDPRWGPVRFERSLSAAKTGPVAGAMPDPLPPVARPQLAKSPPSPAVKNVRVKYEAGAQEVAERLFGRAVAGKDLAAAVGALDGARLSVAAKGHAELRVKIRHKFIEDQERWVRRDAAGKLVIFNYRFYKKRGAPAEVGLDSFQRQVAAARALGVKRLETFGVGNYYTLRQKGEVGYLVWPKLGFDAPLSDSQQRLLNSNAALAGATTLNELMRRPGGEEWWRVNGSDKFLVFDLAENSSMMESFRRYLKRKGRSL